MLLAAYIVGVVLLVAGLVVVSYFDRAPGGIRGGS
jgi:hypothetical protein